MIRYSVKLKEWETCLTYALKRVGIDLLEHFINYELYRQCLLQNISYNTNIDNSADIILIFNKEELILNREIDVEGRIIASPVQLNRFHAYVTEKDQNILYSHYSVKSKEIVLTRTIDLTYDCLVSNIKFDTLEYCVSLCKEQRFK